MLLDLPSGFRATVCSPNLRSVLGGASLAEAALATPDLAVDVLDAADTFYLETWAARELATGDEAICFAEVCALFGARPSAQLGVSDPVLAFELDYAMLRGVTRSPKEHAPAPDDDRERDHFTTGEA